VTLTRSGADWVASGGGLIIRVDGASGWLSSLKLKGVEFLKQPLRPNYWRVPTDNDLGWKVPETMGAWRTAASQAKLKTVEGRSDEAGSRITAVLELPLEKASQQIVYWLRVDGTLHVESILSLGGNPKTPELPRVGVQFAIPADFSKVEWYGRGPHENYRDRKTGAEIADHSARVENWITPYVRPQDNANRTDVRWMRLSPERGPALLIQGDAPLGVSAWPYTTDDLESATHDYRLPRRDFITVNVDGFQMGVGGDNSWGLPVHPEYRLRDKDEYRFGFTLKPD
jgi:beta-galactosidase